MSSIPIQKIRREEDAPPALWQSMQSILDEIQKRAFELFHQRGGVLGWDMDDWLRAERQLIWSPQSELVEREKEYKLRLAVPGLDAKDLEITAMPDSIFVQGQAARRRETKEGEIRFSEFTQEKLFRRFQLPGLIDVDKVTAALDKGILQVTAPKEAAAKKKRITVA